MLAKAMDKPVDFYFGWHIQEKTDGIRALIIKEGSTVKVFGRNQTKKGRADFTDSLPEIVDFFKEAEDFILDCELMSKDFLTLQTKVRTTKTVVYDPFLYVKAFDILVGPNFNVFEFPYSHSERHQLLEEFVASFGEQTFLRKIIQAPKPLDSEDYLNQCLGKVVDKGGEGLILKNPQGLYQPGKRSPHWVKVLPDREMDVMFTGVVKGEGKYGNTLGALVALPYDDYLNAENKRQFNVGTGFDDALRNQIWKNADEENFFPIPGKIKMKDIYPTGIPRMPVFKSFNVDKEK
jgi:ATP-dependent DNA ligase